MPPIESGGVPLTHVVRADTGDIVYRLPGAHGPQPTEEPTVIFARFDSGQTVGRYDLTTHARVGSPIDPGFQTWGTRPAGNRMLVWGEERLRGIDLVTSTVGAPTVDLDDAVILDVAADDDHLLTLECGYGCVVQSRDPHTGAARGESFGVDQGGNVTSEAGVFIVSTSDGRVVEIDPRAMEPNGSPFPGINGLTTALALSNDGRRLLVLGAAQLLRLYDVATRTQLGDAIPVGISNGGVAIRSDGLEAAVATDQGIVVWNLDPAHWIDAACRVAGRNLTRTEWDSYVGDLTPYRPTCPSYPAG